MVAKRLPNMSKTPRYHITGHNFLLSAPPGWSKNATNLTSTEETGFLLTFGNLFLTAVKLPQLSPRTLEEGVG